MDRNTYTRYIHAGSVVSVACLLVHSAVLVLKVYYSSTIPSLLSDG